MMVLRFAQVAVARQTRAKAIRSENLREEASQARTMPYLWSSRRIRIMPLVRIDLIEGKSAEFRKTLGEIIYRAMREVINVPENDKFQVITEHPPEGLNVADNYLGNTYSKDIVIIQITMNGGRTVEMKKAFFKRIADDIHAQLKLRRDDVVINLVECVKENWSFGGGIAQYAE
jgi:phenylpyruvate tautomerase PptA (4-oxalocrotonate tautomerase family)